MNEIIPKFSCLYFPIIKGRRMAGPDLLSSNIFSSPGSRQSTNYINHAAGVIYQPVF